jgi:hypothetical protein
LAKKLEPIDGLEQSNAKTDFGTSPGSR